MQKDDKDRREAQTEEVSPLVQEIMRNLVSAIRAVKLYPPNNPVYAKTINKAFESLNEFLQSAPQYPLGVQKSYFLFQKTPVAKETQLNKAVAQDLFNKGIRELLFLSGLAERELLDLLQVLSLSTEEIALRGGIVSILWEKGSTHIKVTESFLDEVITTTNKAEMAEKALAEPAIGRIDPTVAKQEVVFFGRTLMLGDIVDNPRQFGATMLEVAQKSVGEGETVEDHLHTLYHEAVRKIKEQEPEQQEGLFQGLAHSVLAMEPEHRDRFVTTKLYGELDAESVRELNESVHDHIPDELHEIVTGRYSKQWTGKQVSTLLKKTTAPKARPAVSAIAPENLRAIPLPPDIADMARQAQEYSPEEMEAMKEISEVGMESDIIEATVRTLIFLLPLVNKPASTAASDKDFKLFSGVVHQLEETLSFLVKKKDYDLATLIARAFRLPVDSVFKPRLEDGLRKAAARDIIKKVIADLHGSEQNSPAHRSAHAYLTELQRESVPILLELLAEEKDRSTRRYLLDFLKELGKNQLELFGDRLNDERWYFVRNIVNIVGESKGDQAISMLEKVAGHKNHQIRLEVVKGLLSIGGRKAAALLVRFLRDENEDIQLLSVRGLGAMHGVGRSEIQALMALVKDLAAKRKADDLTLEGLRSLGKTGNADTQLFLQQYLKIRWWRSKKPQEQLRDASVAAIAEIQRRLDHAGPSD